MISYKNIALQNFEEHNEIIEKIISDENIINDIENITNDLVNCFSNNRKLLIFGCGGSAADAQHIAAEFVNGLNLPAIALTTDTSILTSISNDYSFVEVYSKQVNALSGEGDIAMGISTSGNSLSVLQGLETAKSMGLRTILLSSVLFSGYRMLYLNSNFDYIIKVPSKSVPRIQEVHIIIGHILWKGVEQKIHEKEIKK